MPGAILIACSLGATHRLTAVIRPALSRSLEGVFSGSFIFNDLPGGVGTQGDRGWGHQLCPHPIQFWTTVSNIVTIWSKMMTDMDVGGDMEQLPQKPVPGHWVQTEREAHEAWSALIAQSPQAARVMHLLVARVGDHNAVVISQETLAQLLSVSKRTIRRAVATLAQGRWIEIRQIGGAGTVNAYVLNDRVAWTGRRDGIRHSLFSASVIVSEEEQPDQDELGQQAPLRRLPKLGEQQLPSGNGLPPVSQPFLDGMEPQIPATHTKPVESEDI